jgi:hypothetical protein
MRVPAALLALFMLGTFAPPGTRGPSEALPAVSLVRFTPVPLDDSNPGRRRLGALVWLGAWQLTSNDRRFGGVSAMEVENNRVVAFSDAGWQFEFRLPRPDMVSRAAITLLPEGPEATGRKGDRDVESMVLSPNMLWVGLEGRNAVRRYDRATGRVSSAAAPPAMRRWPANRGAEAMLRLADGRFLVFAEGKGSEATSQILLFDGDPAIAGTPAVRMLYAKPRGYRTTDAALLPDGRVLVLNRRFALLEGLSAKLSLLDLGGARQGALLRSAQLADFHRPINVDNMEGLSVTREAGRTIVWIASDDNYNPLQRTLLMKFALDPKIG